MAVKKDTNPKTQYGQAKPPLSLVPGTAMVIVAEAFRDGADKYGPANWRKDPVSASTYFSAALRHGVAYWDGEDIDTASKVAHLGHMAANIMILIDALACGTLIDDRPPSAPTGDLIRANTRPIKPTSPSDYADRVMAFVLKHGLSAAWEWNSDCPCTHCEDYRLQVVEGG